MLFDTLTVNDFSEKKESLPCLTHIGFGNSFGFSFN